MKEKQQFTKLPNEICLKEYNLTRTDPAVYIYIKMHDNENHECYPSFNKIMELTNYSRTTVIASIKRLEAAGFLKVDRKEKKNYYYFPKEGEHFEKFSFDFMLSQKITPEEREYLLQLQHRMLRDKNTGNGYILMSERQLAKEAHIDTRTLKDIETGLQKKDPPILKIVDSNYKDSKTGLPIKKRIYDFDAFYNAVASEFIKVHDELDKKVDYEDINLIKAELKEELKKELKEEMIKQLYEDNQTKNRIIL